MERCAVYRDVGPKVIDDPACHRVRLVRRVVQPGDHEIRDLEPHAGLVLEVLERLQHGLQPAGADAVVEVVRKGLQIDVGGVPVTVEVGARPIAATESRMLRIAVAASAISVIFTCASARVMRDQEPVCARAMLGVLDYPQKSSA